MITCTFARTSLMALAAAGLIAAASAGPAWAQAKTTPDATDCAAMQDSTSQPECQQLGHHAQRGSSLFSRDLDIRVAPPDQRGIGMEDAGGGTQTPVVPNNGARAPTSETGSLIGILHW
jgi:hypothetical protein